MSVLDQPIERRWWRVGDLGAKKKKRGEKRGPERRGERGRETLGWVVVAAWCEWGGLVVCSRQGG